MKQTVRRRQARTEPALELLANETQRLIVRANATNGGDRKWALNSTPTLGMTRNHATQRALRFSWSLLN